MTSQTHDFCRAGLKTARTMAREAGIKLPAGLTTWRDSSTYQPYVEVYAKRDGGLVWSGQACCGAEAKPNFILSLIPTTV